jgi:hypothetical protein
VRPTVEQLVKALPPDVRRAYDDSRDIRGCHLAARALWDSDTDDQEYVVANFTAAAELVGWIAAYGEVDVDSAECLRILYDNCDVLIHLLATNRLVLRRRLAELAAEDVADGAQDGES